MEKVKPKAVSDAREFFNDELRQLMKKHHLLAKKDSFDYVVELLIRYMLSDTFFVKDSEGKLSNNVLVDLYAAYLNGNAEAKIAALQRLGDICLLVTGLFPDSLNRKLIDVDYYFGMGGTAYYQLSCLQFSTLARALYEELSMKFKPFSEVLGELSDRSGLQTNRDLLRLYERWLLTGSDRLKELLSQHGIPTPVAFDPKVRH
jgi:hypothetical protein